jgi:hypothetical protein
MTTVFTATLTGEQEIPPTGSQASGEGTVVWDPTAQTATYAFTIRDLDFGPITGAGETTPSTADDVTNAHFHNAGLGMAGPVVFGQIGPAQEDDLTIVHNADGSWTVSGIWEPSDPANVPIGTFANQLTAAQPGEDVPLYWNVHTTAFPAGEIRGQLVAADDQALAGFDRAFYLAENPDVAATGLDPLQHYLTYGIQEGRQAFPADSGDTASDGDDGTLASGDAPTSANDLSPLG